MIFWTLIAIPIAAAITFPLLYTLNMVLPYFIMDFQLLEIILYTVAVALGTGGIVFSVFLYYPSYLAGGIKNGTDKDIVYIINYMAILAGAGVTTEDIYTSLSKTGGIYKVEGSARSVVRDIELLGKDIVTAIDDESKITPSKKYSRILQGLIGTIRTGGDLRSYLKETADHQMEVRRRELAKLVSSLNLAAEAYIVLGIAFPVILTTLLSMMGMFGGEIAGGLGPTEMMMLMIYLLFPLASIGVLVLIDAVASTW
jgi:flagellar protein FlaJ